jgi:hypothetical protein
VKQIIVTACIILSATMVQAESQAVKDARKAAETAKAAANREFLIAGVGKILACVSKSSYDEHEKNKASNPNKGCADLIALDALRFKRLGNGFMGFGDRNFEPRKDAAGARGARRSQV